MPATQTPTTFILTNWLFGDVEVPAVRYTGSLVDHHGVYALAGRCDDHDRGDCDGWTLIHPTSGRTLNHARRQSFTYITR